jgi:hypothetical protein
MRNLAMNFISNLIERFGNEAIKGVMCVIENILFEGDSGEDKRSADVFFSLLKTGIYYYFMAFFLYKFLIILSTCPYEENVKELRFGGTV